MSQLIFDMNGVQSLSLGLKKNIARLSTCRSGLMSVRGSVDGRITARRSIGTRMNEINTRLNSVEGRLINLDALLQQALEKYGQTEDHLVNQAEEVGNAGKKSLFRNFNDIYAGLVAESNGLVVRNTALFLAANILDSKKLLMLAKDLKFRMFNENGNVYIKIIGTGKNINLKMYKDLLTEYLGGTIKKWDTGLVERLADKGLLLYGTKESKNSNGFTDRSSKFKDTNLNSLNEAVEGLGDSARTRIGNAAQTALKDNLPTELFKDWKGATKLTKVGKGFGILGVGLTVVDNVIDNFYDPETGEWVGGKGKTKEFSVDLSVDVAVGIGSAMAGAVTTAALMGTAFVPPIGTVVGAAAGAALYGAVSWKFIGDPAQSLVDFTKDGANAAVDWAVEGIQDGASAAVDWIGAGMKKLFW